MDDLPWFASLAWSTPLLVEEVRSYRANIPSLAGVYCFTNFPGRLERSTGVLYVGMTKTSLRQRLPVYLVDHSKMLVKGRRGNLSSSLKHAGKVQLLTKIQQRCGSASIGNNVTSGIWVRWMIHPGPKELESRLIVDLRPAYNSSERPADG